MPKVISEADLKPILDAFADLPQVASIEEIAGRLQNRLSRRTLQRRLARLVEQGRLVAEGEKGGRRYRPAPTVAAAATPTGPGRGAEPGRVPLSSAGEAIRQSVTRAISTRKPVGYRAAFLDEYRPNVSAYLPPALRHRLVELGQVTAEIQPAGTYFRKILDRLLIDLSWNSSRLEGNTYSLLETQRLLEAGENAEGKAAEEAQMILNHKAAIELLVEQAADIGFNRYTLCNLHALLSDNLLPDPRVGGRLRTRPVAIQGTTFHPLEVPQAIEEHFDRLLEKAAAIDDAFEQAFFAMVHLPYLQPFDDVNKRVSRIGANIPLFKHNLCPLSFIDVPEHAYIEGTLGVYELNQIELLRDVFVWAYERSCQRYLAIAQTMVEPHLLKIKYREALIQAVQTVVKGLRQPSPAVIAEVAQDHAAEADQAAFREMLTAALQQLHEGSIARYRLRRSAYIAWQHAQDQA